MELRLTNVSALRKTEVFLKLDTSEHWKPSKVTLRGDKRSKKKFLEDFELACGSHGLTLDPEALTWGDLSVALSNKLRLWVPDKPLVIEPEETELEEGALW